MKLDLQSERYAPTGNISGAGVRRSLGTPSLDPLQIVVRETAQNVWDARVSDSSPVTFRVHVRPLTPKQNESLSSLIASLPATGRSRELLAQSLGRKPLDVIELSDFGTSGLGGPARADQEPASGERPDFANFFRNVGSPRDRELGAGTYGYGKSAMYRLSRCGTILAYTQTMNAGRDVTRLMGACIGEPYQHKRHRYTGRHWWGIADKDSIVDPLQGVRAHSVAESLGFARRERDQPGTSIFVVDPDLEERTHAQVVNAVAECLAWFFWPKMIEHADGQPSMKFELLGGGVDRVLDLNSFAPLEIFAEAMNRAKQGKGTRISCERPIQALGTVAFARGPRRPRQILDTGSERSLIPQSSACVALMRPAELVVKYLSGPSLPSDMVEYAGVFICDDEVESSFADAEPPAHDDWIPDFLDGRARSFVRVALRKIASAIDQYAAPPAVNELTAEQQSLAGLGDALGGVLIGQSGSRAGERESSGARSASSPVNKKILISEPLAIGFTTIQKLSCALFLIRISCASPSELKLSAQALIVLEGGATTAPDEDAPPKVIGWLDSTGRIITAGATAEISCGNKTLVHVAVSVRDDAAIALVVDNLSQSQ